MMTSIPPSLAHFALHTRSSLSHSAPSAWDGTPPKNAPLTHLQAYTRQPFGPTAQPLRPPSTPLPPSGVEDDPPELEPALQLAAKRTRTIVNADIACMVNLMVGWEISRRPRWDADTHQRSP